MARPHLGLIFVPQECCALEAQPHVGQRRVTVTPFVARRIALGPTEAGPRTASHDVVYQGVFVDPDGWRGVADFIEH